MPTAYGSTVINGQLISVSPMEAYAPATLSPTYIPAYVTSGGISASPMSGQGAVASTGPITSAAHAPVAGSAWSLTQSPVILAVLFLIIGMAGLRYLHWKG